jgi:hypothetical protein
MKASKENRKIKEKKEIEKNQGQVVVDREESDLVVGE